MVVLVAVPAAKELEVLVTLLIHLHHKGTTAATAVHLLLVEAVAVLVLLVQLLHQI
jgi:hypothetical protein